MLKGALLVLVALIGAATVSAAYGLMDAHADVVFLALLAWTAVAIFTRGKIINNQTNGIDTGGIVFFTYPIATTVCIFIGSVFTFVGIKTLLLP